MDQGRKEEEKRKREKKLFEERKTISRGNKEIREREEEKEKKIKKLLARGYTDCDGHCHRPPSEGRLAMIGGDDDDGG